MARLEIDLSDCNAIVSKLFQQEAFEIVNFSLVPYSKNAVGSLGEHMYLKIEAKLNEEVQDLGFFTKKLNTSSDVRRKSRKIVNTFTKERFFYQKFLKEVQRCTAADLNFVPKYFHAKNYAIILEDLNDFRVCSSFDLDHLKKVLEEVAKLHAASLGYEEYKKEVTGKKWKLTDEFAEYLQEALYRKEDIWERLFVSSCAKGLCTLVDFLPENGLAKEEFKEKLNLAVEDLFERFNQPNKFTNVLCHGDLWQKNILFKYNQGVVQDCKLVDYQVCRYAPPAHDVTFLIYQTTTESTRQNHYQQLLEYYYEKLGLELEKLHLDVETILPLDEFEETCVYYMKAAKLIKALHGIASLDDQECQELLQTNSKEYYKCIFDDRSAAVTELFKTNPTYKATLTELLKNIEEFLKFDALTKEDCYLLVEKALKRKTYKIDRFEAIPLGELSGFLGEHIKMSIHVRNSEPLHFFVKRLPLLEVQKQFAMETGASFKEHRFFKKLIPNLLQRNISFILDCVPECYLSRLYDVTVFEDLILKGYTMWPPRKSLDFDTVCLTLKNLVKLHASIWIFEEKVSKELGRDYRILEDYEEEFEEAFYTSNKVSLNLQRAAKRGMLTELNMFPNLDSTEISEEVIRENAVDYFKFENFVKPSKKVRNTLCHGDLWRSNIMYNVQEKKCKFVDFQSYRYVPPTNDLLTFIYLTTNRDFRSKHMLNVLNFYYEQLRKILHQNQIDIKNVLKYEDFLESCKFDQQMAVAQTVSHFHCIQLSSTHMKEILADPECSQQFIHEDRTEMLLKIAAEDPEYKAKLHESVRDLRDLSKNPPFFF